ncbi:MAG: hypothetical protein V1493_02245, partial [Candidatus Diapherotrites archaeon]
MGRQLFILFFLVFSLGLVFAEDFQFPAFEQQNLGCESGKEISQKYGLNRILLDWDADKITETMCDVDFREGESGYFCDATQFGLMLSKRLSSGAGLNGLSVLLLADNYSDSFKADFTEHYSGSFFGGKKIDISKWSFKNSPTEPGLYTVEATVEGEAVSVEFSLAESLEGLDKRLGTNFNENHLFGVAFDAFSSDKERDFGLVAAGDIFYLNDGFLLPASGTVSGPETEKERTFADTASGLVLAVAEAGPGKFYWKFNESIPSVVSLYLSEEKTHEIYYTLTDSAGRPRPDSFFADSAFLLNWRVPEKFFVKDSFPVLKPGIKCSGWNDDIKSAKFKADAAGFGSLYYLAVAFLPEGTALEVLCVSGNVRLDMNSYNGMDFGFRHSISPGPNQLSFSSLQPESFEGVFSLKDALAEVGKGNMCFISDESGTNALIWNAKAFREMAFKEKGKGNAESPAKTPVQADNTAPYFAPQTGLQWGNIKANDAFGGLLFSLGLSKLVSIPGTLAGAGSAGGTPATASGACAGPLSCFGNSTFPCCDSSSGLCVECTSGCGCSEGEQCSLFTNSCMPKEAEPGFAETSVDNLVVSATKKSDDSFELATASGETIEVQAEDLQTALADLELQSGYMLSQSLSGVNDIQNPSMTICDTIVLVPDAEIVKQDSKGAYVRSSTVSGGLMSAGLALVADDAVLGPLGIPDDVVGVVLIAAAGIQLLVTKGIVPALSGRTIYIPYSQACPLSPSITVAPPVVDAPTLPGDTEVPDVGVETGAEEGTAVKIGNTIFILTDNGIKSVKQPPPEDQEPENKNKK